MNTTTATFTTKAEAQALVSKLDNRTYVLAHGEYERPDYSVRKVRGENLYYIFVRRYFYAGTFHAAKSGPLDGESAYYANH